MAEESKNNFLIKIDKIRSKSVASTFFLKPDDVIVAVNNNFYTYGEKRFTEELIESKKNNEKCLITILRDKIFFDIIVSGSLGCKFLTTNQEETERIKNEFSSKENYDLEELNEYIVMRDVYRRYDVYENSSSLSAAIFPPLWLAYSQKWWVLLSFTLFFLILLSVNGWVLLLGWLLSSIYCYKAQLNLLFSFSMLEGKAFSMKFASKSIDEAHKVIRALDPKSKFKYSRLPDPIIDDEKEEKQSENNNNDKNIVDENKEALV